MCAMRIISPEQSVSLGQPQTVSEEFTRQLPVVAAFLDTLLTTSHPESLAKERESNYSVQEAKRSTHTQNIHANPTANFRRDGSPIYPARARVDRQLRCTTGETVSN